LSREQIMEVLSKIIHPGTGKSITEMGMVSDAGFTDSGIVIFLQVAKAQDPLIN
jgi:metal-sulfur cluster biosynthetic enzyme